MTHVQLSQVSKSYAQRGRMEGPQAVDKISFEVQSGEFFVILGPSGCGKTTTLRMIAGLEQITSGEIFLDEKRVNTLTPGQRNLAMAFEAYALYPPLNVYENLAYGLRARHTPSKEIDQRVREIAGLLEMEDTLRARPRELSGGQQQLVSLARALVRGAPLLLLDEPLSHLEPARRFRVRTAIKDFTARARMTVIYVTHDQVEATALADRIAVMSMGHLQQVGTPTELWNTPVNSFVAGFIGEPPMNFLAVDAFRNKELVAAQWEGEQGAGIRVGVRPQDLHLLEERAAPASLLLDGVVSNLQWLGHESQLFCDIAATPIIAVLSPDTQESFQPGQTVQLGVPMQNIHLFDEQGALVEQKIGQV